MNNFLIKLIKFKSATFAVIIISILIVLFHCLVITQVIPYDIVWAGKLKSTQEMYQFETVSLIINFFLIFVILVNAEIIKLKINRKVIWVIILIFAVLFALNTIGNLTAQSNIEKYTATPITFILFILMWRLLLKKDN